MDVTIKKVISMIIQTLRDQQEVALIETIKKASYSLDWLRYDNWNGGITYYKLVFHLKYSDFSKIINNKVIYEHTIKDSLDIFYADENNVIDEVEIVARIDQFVDWAAVAPDENKDSVILLINNEKDTLIKAGTGVIQIRDKKVNDNYIAKHTYLCGVLEQLGLDPVHQYTDLWDWYNDYNNRELDTYKKRRQFINDLFQPLLQVIMNSEESDLNLVRYEPTGWESIDDGVRRMKEILVSADSTEDYQSVGMFGRELLITLAQTVFNREKHAYSDGMDIGNADSKRMLEAYVKCCFQNRCKEREIKFIKTTIDFSNEMTHNRTAIRVDAELCYVAVLSTIQIIKALSKHCK